MPIAGVAYLASLLKIRVSSGWSVDSWRRWKPRAVSPRSTRPGSAGDSCRGVTHTLTLLYQAGPLVVERTLGQSFAWLPKGRSLFCDKRTRRDNLNGQLIERSGMSAVLYGLSGIDGPRAQDPPYYAGWNDSRH